MIIWWYLTAAADGSNQQHSVSEQELISLLQSRQLTRQTLVWREGMENWQPVQDIAALVPHLAIYASYGRRYFARMIDLCWEYTLALFLFIILINYADILEHINSWTCIFILLLLILAFSTIIVENSCYWLFKKTPGKWITGIVVTDKTGKPANRITYFKRNLYIYFLVLGCNIPLLSLMTILAQDKRIAKKRYPWYDKKLSLEVRVAKPMNIIAIVVVICLMILSLLFFLLVMMVAIVFAL